MAGAAPVPCPQCARPIIAATTDQQTNMQGSDLDLRALVCSECYFWFEAAAHSMHMTPLRFYLLSDTALCPPPPHTPRYRIHLVHH
jgi:hypothetical protein